MTENQSYVGPRGRNDDFIRSIKDKYSSISKPTKRSPSKYLLPPAPTHNDRSMDKYNNKQVQRLNGTPLQNKHINNDPYQPLNKSYLNHKDYQTLRNRYEDKQPKPTGYNKDLTNKKQANHEVYNERQDQFYKVELQNKGPQSTNKSSPIKKFYYDSIPKNNDNFLLTRKNEIVQLHQKRANQHKIEREKTQQTIASIDNLLENIRKTLTHPSQHAR